jgi:hypothetical protein
METNYAQHDGDGVAHHEIMTSREQFNRFEPMCVDADKHCLASLRAEVSHATLQQNTGCATYHVTRVIA